MGCQPGDCIWSLHSSSGVCVGMYGLTYSLYHPQGDISNWTVRKGARCSTASSTAMLTIFKDKFSPLSQVVNKERFTEISWWEHRTQGEIYQSKGGHMSPLIHSPPPPKKKSVLHTTVIQQFHSYNASLGDNDVMPCTSTSHCHNTAKWAYSGTSLFLMPKRSPRTNYITSIG